MLGLTKPPLEGWGYFHDFKRILICRKVGESESFRNWCLATPWMPCGSEISSSEKLTRRKTWMWGGKSLRVKQWIVGLLETVKRNLYRISCSPSKDRKMLALPPFAPVLFHSRHLLFYMGSNYVPSQSLTWNLKMVPWNRRFLLETLIFRFQPLNLGSV